MYKHYKSLCFSFPMSLQNLVSILPCFFRILHSVSICLKVSFKRKYLFLLFLIMCKHACARTHTHACTHTEKCMIADKHRGQEHLIFQSLNYTWLEPSDMGAMN